MSIPLTTKRRLGFMPPDLRAEHPEIVFEIRVPSYQDRDEIGLRLYRLGLREISTDNIRALMISELFELPFTGTVPEGVTPEAAADAAAAANAMFLEGVWTQDQLDANEQSEWEMQEQQRLADIAAGANPEPEAKPRPPRRTGVRDRAKVSLLVQDMVDGSQKVRDKLADQQSYDIHYRIAMVRLHLAGIIGLNTKFSMSGGLVDFACIESLREELGHLSTIAYNELVQEIINLYELPTVEVGNSDLPPESTSVAANGSAITSAESGESDGSLTKPEPVSSSSISPAPSDASPTTTETSLEPSPVAETSTAPSAGPTTEL